MTSAVTTEPTLAAEIEEHAADSTVELLTWALARFHPRIALACSFQHTILLDMLVKIEPDVNVFAIDTGRLPEETYQCAADVEEHFGIKVKWYTPKTESLEHLLNTEGTYSFKKSIEARRSCCHVRKVEPLTRALSELDAWITGTRRDQSETRKDTKRIEIDGGHNGIVKINPLADWTKDDIYAYGKEHNLPYNPLFEKGYASIGCACCTRATAPGESSRAGRWWWEEEDQKECGLHVRDWNI
jgi:thioredoxin-dependent adenylylsulfate APS reductase